LLFGVAKATWIDFLFVLLKQLTFALQLTFDLQLAQNQYYINLTATCKTNPRCKSKVMQSHFKKQFSLVIDLCESEETITLLLSLIIVNMKKQ